MAESGIAVAAKFIGRKLCELGKGVLAEIDNISVSAGAEKAMKNGRVVTVAGSPKFRVYETDFGWGRPKNCEVVHIGANGAFSFNESREEEGGVQIGVVVNREKLDLFNAVFDLRI
ncbi:hypothetical protein Q3G72_011106 [Acer saccharum]|nr:hypothetical protein Q3G72_011106 [Acer saccharum]